MPLQMSKVQLLNLDRCYRGALAREKLKADAARAREEVERLAPLKIGVVEQNVEQILLCKVGRGPCLKITRNVKMPPFVFAAYYSHRISACKSNGIPSVLFSRLEGKSSFVLIRFMFFMNCAA